MDTSVAKALEMLEKAAPSVVAAVTKGVIADGVTCMIIGILLFVAGLSMRARARALPEHDDFRELVCVAAYLVLGVALIVLGNGLPRLIAPEGYAFHEILGR